MCKTIDLPVGNTTIQVWIHKDNAEALVLTETKMPEFTSRSGTTKQVYLELRGYCEAWDEVA